MSVVIEKEKVASPLEAEGVTEMALLCKAADKIEKSGWTTGSLTSHGRVCAIGAIEWAADDLGLELEEARTGIIRRARERLARVISHLENRTRALDPYNIEDWNDCLSERDDRPEGGWGKYVARVMRLAGDC